MFTLTVKAKDGSERIESFDSIEQMRSMYSTYLRCGITAISSVYVDAIYDLPSPRIR